eukprot:6176817-Pyramimonas_sp.AAC.1
MRHVIFAAAERSFADGWTTQVPLHRPQTERLPPPRPNRYLGRPNRCSKLGLDGELQVQE